MKLTTLLLAIFFLLTPFLLSAQDYLGSWQWETEGPEGQAMTTTMTFHKDGTYTVDFGTDATIEIRGKYKYADGKMTIKDSSEGACKDIEAVYSLTIDGNTATAKAIKDPCPVRAGDGTPMVMKRKE